LVVFLLKGELFRQSFFTKGKSEKKTEDLTTCAFNHPKAKNSLPDKEKIRPNSKTQQYNPLLI